MDGPEFSIDCLSRPRRALPERDPADDDRVARWRVDQGHGDRRPGADRARAPRRRGARRARARARSRCSATARSASGITDVNTRFGGAFPAPMYAALPGRTYPELIVRMARGERIEPHVGEFRPGVTFTRYYWQLELDGGTAARPGATSSSRPGLRRRTEGPINRGSARRLAPRSALARRANRAVRRETSTRSGAGGT